MNETILVFGGNSQRLDKAIELAKQKPDTYLIYSSGEKRSIARKKLEDNGIYSDRYLLEYNALDTVTNCTENYHNIKSKNTHILYLVTDHWHMPRCRAIANIVFSLTGIKIKEYPLITNSNRQESKFLINTDKCRAALWKTTGLVFFPQHVKNRRKDLELASKQ